MISPLFNKGQTLTLFPILNFVCLKSTGCIYSKRAMDFSRITLKHCPGKAKYHALLLMALCIFFLTSSCTLSVDQSPKISSDTLYVYPLEKAELECVASSPKGDALTFKWSCIEGTFKGIGPVVTWMAPNNYGKFHIMVIAEDSKGNSSQKIVTIEVVANENQQQGCSTCPGR
jgi:hypothetical protein